MRVGADASFEIVLSQGDKKQSYWYGNNDAIVSIERNPY